MGIDKYALLELAQINREMIYFDLSSWLYEENENDPLCGTYGCLVGNYCLVKENED